MTQGTCAVMLCPKNHQTSRRGQFDTQAIQCSMLIIYCDRLVYRLTDIEQFIIFWYCSNSTVTQSWVIPMVQSSTTMTTTMVSSSSIITFFQIALVNKMNPQHIFSKCMYVLSCSKFTLPTFFFTFLVYIKLLCNHFEFHRINVSGHIKC